MKLIEAMKKIKELQEKADDLENKVSSYCAHLSIETPTYDDQRAQVRRWIQSHSDIKKEVLRLRIAVQKTNLATDVSIDLNDSRTVTKSVAEWIHRRRDLASSEEKIWSRLGDKGLREGMMKQSSGEDVQVKIVRCFDPKERDIKVASYQAEPQIIDSKLEVVNAITDLIE